jgi:eukaryotic-like serine/threonine-protein kinase
MPFLNCSNLMGWLRSQPCLIHECAAAIIAREIALATHYGHEQGVIHRDLKPQNILMHPDPAVEGGFRPVILDFGLSVMTNSVDAHSSLLHGTPKYMAPEQMLDSNPTITEKCDIYSIGVILYQMLTDQTPLVATSITEAIALLPTAKIEPPSNLRPDLSPDMDTICLKCLRRDPTRRYASAQELAEDLDRLLKGVPIVARTSGWVEKLEFEFRFNGWDARLGELIIVMNCAMLAWAFISPLLLRLRLAEVPTIAHGFAAMIYFLVGAVIPVHLLGIYWGHLLKLRSQRNGQLALGTLVSALCAGWCIASLAGNAPISSFFEGASMAQVLVLVFAALGFTLQTTILAFGTWAATQRARFLWEGRIRPEYRRSPTRSLT